MEGTGGFSALNWSKTNPPRFSECRLLMLYKGVKMCGRNFLPSDFGDVLANLATTNRVMDKWMLWLDSAGQKGPEITLEGILIVVEGCLTAERSGSGSWLDQHTLLPMAPIFLHISRKLLSSLLAQQHGVYCHGLPGSCVRKCRNRGVCGSGSIN